MPPEHLNEQAQTLQVLPLLVWSAPPDGRVNSWNRDGQRFLGPPADPESSYLEETGAFARWVHPEDLRGLETAWQACLKSGAALDRELRLRRLEGGLYRWHRMQAVPVRDASGRVVQWCGVGVDVHERWQLEHTLRASQAEVNQLRERHLDLVSNVGCALRAPLTALVGNLELLMYPRTPEAEQRQALLEAEQQALRLQRLVRDLLKLAHQQRSPVPNDPFDLCKALRGAFKAARHLARGQALRLAALEPCWVQGSPDSLRQIARHLLANALRYTPRGGKVGLTLELGQGYGEFCVWDTGIGIALEDQPHVFERFYRSEQARHLEVDGTGLGLSIVQGVVQTHGGQIRLTSVEGMGSRFYVRLPTVLSPLPLA